MADRCDCCDLPVESCGKAAEQRQRAEAQRERTMLLARTSWFEASYPGTCSSCGERFPAGEPITKHGGGYKASCCDNKGRPWLT